METIYLDNAATTKPLAQLKEVYERYEQELWYNPSALYNVSAKANKALNDVRKTLLAGFGSTLHKCIFTGSGTEGANMVILRGISKKKHMNFVCGGAEHPCVEQSMKQWEAEGYEVRWIKPEQNGCVLPKNVADAVDEHTALVSVMHVNNETGAKNDIESIGALIKAKNQSTLFHSDGVQAYLKEKIVDCSNIDYYTVSAHKVHAHKGTGALFYKQNSPLKPYLLGGGQENGLRSATQDMLGILSFGRSTEYYMQNEMQIKEKLCRLREVFLEECKGLEQIEIISPIESGYYSNHILSVSILGVNGETLLHTLEAEGIYISIGSACSSKKGKSRIATALGLNDEVAQGIIRISFSHFNTKEEIKKTVASINKNMELLRKYKRY